ncbi:MAG: hypothetical protein LUG60_11990 [Erysipelotrichaceae bacterium]|nr:hypothetical protein [Erysipelotrichaceae bacterium]
MQNLLKIYYDMSIDIDRSGYFHYQNDLYYLQRLNDTLSFLNIYHYYRYLLQQCHLSGYMIISNNQHQCFTNNYVLLKYINEPFLYDIYLSQFLIPLSLPTIKISNIKQQWIDKMDHIYHKIETYDEKMKPLIIYYLGLGENSINILNYLLDIDRHASIPVGLALSTPIENNTEVLLNPCNYIVSSRIRQLVILLESYMLSINQLKSILNNHYFDVYEIIYLYAHSLYPGYFFDCILKNQSMIPYYQNISHEKQLIKDIYQLLLRYVSLPKIHWINDENML